MEVDFPSTLTTIEPFAFQNTSLKEIIIPEGVARIEKSTFSDNQTEAEPSFTKVSLPNTLTYIGEQAFSGCKSLKEITIPDNVTEIAKSAFNGCYNLATVMIGDGVTTIGNTAFQDCGVETIVLGKSVSSIGDNAFNNRSSRDDYYKNLKSITCKGETPASLGKTPFPVDGWETYNYKIYVPSDAVQTYKSAWSAYKNKIQAITE